MQISKSILISLMMVLSVLALQAGVNSSEKEVIYPEPRKGFERYMIELPEIDSDENHRVELIIGKTMLADCNTKSLLARISKYRLKGWGYSYLEVRDIRKGPSTMMACVEPATEKFIMVRATTETMQRYNSKVPIVIYVPKGFEVHYRIWSADSEVREAEKR